MTTELMQLPKRASGQTTAFNVAGTDGYFTTITGVDGNLIDLRVVVAKQGSTIRGILDAVSDAISEGLRRGMELEALERHYVGMRFEPSGPTDDPEIPFVTSIMDYVFRRIRMDMSQRRKI